MNECYIHSLMYCTEYKYMYKNILEKKKEKGKKKKSYDSWGFPAIK